MRKILLFALITFFIPKNLLFSQSQEKYQSILLNDSLTTNANAVVRYDYMSIDIKSQRSMVMTQQRIVTVLNKNGNRFVRAYKHYDKTTKIKSIQAIIFDASGEEIKKIKRNDFIDRSAVDGGTLYSDSRVLYIDYTPTSYPYTVEFTSEVETSNTAFIPNWYFMDGYNVSTQESNFLIKVNSSDIELRIKERNFDRYNIVKNNENGKISYNVKKLPSLKPESLSPPFREIAPNIIVAANKFHLKGVDGEAKNWDELGKWQYDKLLTNRDEVTEETKSKILELVKNIDDPIEKAKIVYQYVQNNTRYISVQVGIGGWMPIAAIEVDKVKYGDCKGLTNYTKALLKVAGIPSNYSVVFAGRNDKINVEADFASMQGNHVILNVPFDEGDIWLECTSQTLPFGFLGSFTDDRNVLLVTKDGGEIVKTVSYKNEDNYQKTSGNYEIDENGNINGSVKIKTRGTQYNRRYGIENNSKEDNIKRYKEYFDNINNLSIHNFSFENNKEDVEFTETIDVSATKYVSNSNNRMMFVVNAFNKESYVPNRYRNRKLPFQITRGYMDEDEVLIHIPKGYKIEAIPNDEKVETKFGEYEISFITDDDHTIKYRKKMLEKNGSYSKDEYKDYRSFRRKVSRLEDSKIVLIKE